MGLVVALAACGEVTTGPVGPEELPLDRLRGQLYRAVCERAHATCRCDQWTIHDTIEECDLQVVALVRTLHDLIDRSVEPLTYDPRCADDYVRRFDELDCSPRDTIDPVSCEAPCQLVHGDRQAGEPCEMGGQLINDCASGLLCTQGTCVDLCNGGPTGPFARAGDSCLERDCAVELDCDPATQRCQPLPAEGEPCPLGRCRTGMFCEPAMIGGEPRCTAPIGVGGPCSGHDQCESLYCPAGFCRPSPGEGESCADRRVCGRGLQCELDECVPGDAMVCVQELR